MDHSFLGPNLGVVVNVDIWFRQRYGIDAVFRYKGLRILISSARPNISPMFARRDDLFQPTNRFLVRFAPSLQRSEGQSSVYIAEDVYTQSRFL